MMPTPPSIRSARLAGNTFMISKNRNRRKAAAVVLSPGGKRKLANKNPAISSMTILWLSFSLKISSPFWQNHVANTINVTRVNRERGNDVTAIRFKAKERGIARRVPAVPGIQGMYPVPAPVAKNRINLCSLKMRCSGQLGQ